MGAFAELVKEKAPSLEGIAHVQPSFSQRVNVSICLRVLLSSAFHTGALRASCI